MQLGGVLCQLFCPGRLARTGLIHHYYKNLRTRNCPFLYPVQPPVPLSTAEWYYSLSYTALSRTQDLLGKCIPAGASHSLQHLPVPDKLPGAGCGLSVLGTGCVSPAQPPRRVPQPGWAGQMGGGYFSTLRGQFYMSFSPGMFSVLCPPRCARGSCLTLWSRDIVVPKDFHLLCW